MKTFLFRALLFAALPAVLAAAKPSERPDLQIRVDVPAMVDPLHEDDVIEVFADSIRDAFRRRGYDGRIEELYWSGEPAADIPLLSIQIIRWERTRTGGIDCTFHARIRPAGGEERSLGSFNQHELGLAITNRWTLHEAFRDAAERAAEQMYRRLAKLAIIPGIRAEADSGD